MADIEISSGDRSESTMDVDIVRSHSIATLKSREFLEILEQKCDHDEVEEEESTGSDHENSAVSIPEQEKKLSVVKSSSRKIDNFPSDTFESSRSTKSIETEQNVSIDTLVPDDKWSLTPVISNSVKGVAQCSTALKPISTRFVTSELSTPRSKNDEAAPENAVDEDHIKQLGSNPLNYARSPKTIENVPLLPSRCYVKLERIKPNETYDAFSEDEEPVLRTSYSPHVRGREDPEMKSKWNPINQYNAREGVPQPVSVAPYTILVDFEDSTKIRKRVSIESSCACEVSSRSAVQDITPHQRDLTNVSFEELSARDVAVLRGLWKCIAFDLHTFGTLTTINFFKIRGYIREDDQKATPDVIMRCRFLWPHAHNAMESLEKVVVNLHRPFVSHKIIYDLGRKHSMLKIALNEDQCQLVINAFLYTFSQQVRPKLSLDEARILRKFANVTMFLLMDASRWDSTPIVPF